MADDAGGIFQSIRFWQGWAVFATAAALFTFIAHAEIVVDGHTPDYVATIGDDAARWVVNVDSGGGSLQVRPDGVSADADRRHVLWIVGVGEPASEDEGRPTGNVRLGVLPTGAARGSMRLNAAAAELLARGRSLGVGLEASDEERQEPGSWLYQASLTRL